MRLNILSFYYGIQYLQGGVFISVYLDIANPVISRQNPTAPEDRQLALLVSTNEARAHKERRMTFPLPPAQLLNEATALVHAERALHTEGIPALSRQQHLGKLVLPFGQYLNA